MRPELYVKKAGQRVWAVRWHGDPDSLKSIVGLGAHFEAPEGTLTLSDDGSPGKLLAGVNGEQGWVEVPIGSWVLKGGANDYWPVANDVFEQTYERKF